MRAIRPVLVLICAVAFACGGSKKTTRPPPRKDGLTGEEIVARMKQDASASRMFGVDLVDPTIEWKLIVVSGRWLGAIATITGTRDGAPAAVSGFLLQEWTKEGTLRRELPFVQPDTTPLLGAAIADAPVIAKGTRAERANVSLAETLLAASSSEDVEAMLPLYTDDFVAHWAGAEETVGIAALETRLRETYAAMSDIRYTPIAIFAAGDWVVSATIVSMRVDAGDVRLTARGATPMRVVDGRVEESWSFVRVEERKP
jgi:ketosteroid isomerase-like protein